MNASILSELTKNKTYLEHKKKEQDSDDGSSSNDFPSVPDVPQDDSQKLTHQLPSTLQKNLRNEKIEEDMDDTDIPKNDSQKLIHRTLHRVPTPNRKPPSQRMRLSNPNSPLRENSEEHTSKISTDLASELNIVPICNSIIPDQAYVEAVDKPILTEVSKNSERTNVSLQANVTIMNNPDTSLGANVKDSQEISESRHSDIMKEDTEDQDDINTPILTNKTTEKDTRKEKVAFRSLTSVLSDYFFIIIGICFFIEWVEVIVQVIPLFIMLFASVIMFQLWMKNFKV